MSASRRISSDVREPSGSSITSPTLAEIERLGLRERTVGQSLDDPVCDPDDLGGVLHLFEENGELVAAQASEGIPRSKDRRDATTDLDQQFVSRTVTVGVVHGLELVDVDEQDARGP